MKAITRITSETLFKIIRICITFFFLFLTYNGLAQDTAKASSAKESNYSFGGEVRYQYFYFENKDWGAAPPDKDGFILSRYLGHAQILAGKHFRAFAELQSSLSSGQVAPPSAVDENTLDLHQAYLDYSVPVAKGRKIILRAGRQELSYGSQRLVAVREGPNNRQSFDAVKAIYGAQKMKLDLFYANYVTARPNIFDDKFSSAIQFWGAYSTFSGVVLFKNLDIYYLGIHKKLSSFDEGKGPERRHSVGARAWKNSPVWRYDIEGLYQFGKFNGSSISAWTLSSNTSYSFQKARSKPQLGLKIEAISGDKNRNDGKLNTFNPLFPRGAYFGLAALIGPYNLFDAHPYAQISLGREIIFSMDYDLFWRMSRNDGLYAVSGKAIYKGDAGKSKQIGRQLGAALEFPMGKYVDFKQELTWFDAGRYLKEAGPGEDILMVGSTLTFKF